ncbi:uncharacterized protein LOC112272451 [Brachypodium distachyon]|nr:uncharacterized protein LOC112272451 [Brachypodium distachyon]|eukprot:XP_024319004.1 uncharacterized protein LOC112272451 [Brachypodium distachyon]
MSRNSTRSSGRSSSTVGYDGYGSNDGRDVSVSRSAKMPISTVQAHHGGGGHIPRQLSSAGEVDPRCNLPPNYHTVAPWPVPAHPSYEYMFLWTQQQQLLLQAMQTNSLLLLQAMQTNSPPAFILQRHGACLAPNLQPRQAPGGQA